MKRNWKALTAVCCAAVLTLSLTACSGSSGSNTVPTAPPALLPPEPQERKSLLLPEDRFNIHIGDAFSTVDPHNLSLNADMMLSRQIYEPLYWLNDSAEEVPMLATEYSVSEDGLTWTFKLRDGVTFQNGEA